MLSGGHDLFPTYRGKKILITGHTGFKGSWLSLWLAAMECEVAGFSLPAVNEPSHFKELPLKRIKSYEGNLLDRSRIKEVLQDFQPQVIFHLAAQAIVKDSYLDPISTFETNIMGSLYLYQAIRECPSIETLVSISSDKVYAPHIPLKSFSEGDALGGIDPYSASKSAMEIVSRSFWESFFKPEGRVKMATCRSGNVIGGGDWQSTRILPGILMSHFTGKDLKIRTPGAVRPWIHVLDVLKGYLLVGQKLNEKNESVCTAFNLGPDEPQSVRHLVGLVQKNLPDFHPNFGEGQDPQYLSLATSKAKQLLDWERSWDLETSVSKTVEWYKRYYLKGDILSEDQLKDYLR